MAKNNLSAAEGSYGNISTTLGGTRNLSGNRSEKSKTVSPTRLNDLLV